MQCTLQPIDRHDAHADLARSWHDLVARVAAYLAAATHGGVARPDLGAERSARTREVVTLLARYLGATEGRR